MRRRIAGLGPYGKGRARPARRRLQIAACAWNDVARVAVRGGPRLVAQDSRRNPPGSPVFPGPEAVDAALCHGWIDGQLDSFDERSLADPLHAAAIRPASGPRETAPARWSLVKLGRHAPTRHRRRSSDARKRRPLGARPMRAQSTAEVPDDLRAALAKNKKAGGLFRNARSRRTATRSSTGSTTPRSRRPGRPGSRSSSRCWPRARRIHPANRREDRPQRRVVGRLMRSGIAVA